MTPTRMYLAAAFFSMPIGTSQAQYPSASEVGRIVGTVLDSASGRPIVRARVGASRSRAGAQYTDSSGRFSIQWVRPGVVDFQLLCPRRILRGRMLLEKPLRVFANDSVIVRLLVDESVCEEPPYRAVRGQVRGSFSSGFEISALRMCADSALGIPGGPTTDPLKEDPWSDLRAWVKFSPEALANWNRDRSVFAGDSTRSQASSENGSLFVRFEGVLRGPGRFGHLGGSPYEFTVEKTLYRGVGDASACSRPPDGMR